MRKILCSALLLFLLCIPNLQRLSAQVSYLATYHPQAGNPGNLNQESDQSEVGWQTIMQAGIAQNQWSQKISIPFSFAYYGRSVNEFQVSANGLLSFLSDPQLPSGDNVKLPSSQLPDSTVACFWERFTTSAPTGSNDVVQTKTFGFAPNRQFWVRWTSFEWGNSNFQFVAIVLEEGSHDIHLVDMYGNQFGPPVTGTVGLQASSGFAVSQGEASTGLNGISPSYLDNSYYTFNTYDIEPYDLDVLEILDPSPEGCGVSNEQVRVRFSNVGLLTASGMTASFSVDGGPFSLAESIPQNLEAGEEMEFTFERTADLSSTGTHTITVLVEVPGDGNLSNNSRTIEVNSTLSVSSFPYVENFEQGAGGWSEGGDNSSWELAYPNAQIMQGAASGVKAWVTNPNGNYYPLEKSYVISPCFDFSSAHPDMHISMNIWWETEYSWDGTVLQATINGGETWFNIGAVNSTPNWFNDNTIGALPGDSPFGWTGSSAEGNGSGGWVNVQHPLGGKIIGENQVRFRIAFGSDNAGFNEGFAFDDIRLDVPPQIDLGEDRFFCEGETLNVDPTENNILWSTGSSSSEIQLSHSGSSPIIDSLIVVTITGSNGMTGRDSIYVSMTPQMQFAYAAVTNIPCAGGSNGSIELDISGGSTPLSFTWSNGATQSGIGDLDTGTYEVLIEDLNGCKIDSSFAIQSLNAPLELDYTTSHAACDGSPIGTINLNAFGGVGGYSYSWNTGGAGSMRENLEAGEYMVTTTDQLGCERVDTILVEMSGDLTINVENLQNPSCIDDLNGSVEVSIEGGSGTYEIFWDHGDSTQNIDLLGVGTYTGYVLDTDGCNKLLPEIQLEPETAPAEAAFDYTISGSTIGFYDLSDNTTSYVWDFGDGTATSTEASPAHFYLSNGTYTVTLIASNSCGSDTTTQQISLQTVGIQNEFDEDITFFPNPFSDRVVILFGQPTTETFKLEVMNLQGQIMHVESGSQGVSRISVDVPQHLAKGIYLLRLSGKESQSVIRIIKQ